MAPYKTSFIELKFHDFDGIPKEKGSRVGKLKLPQRGVDNGNHSTKTEFVVHKYLREGIEPTGHSSV